MSHLGWSGQPGRKARDAGLASDESKLTQSRGQGSSRRIQSVTSTSFKVAAMCEVASLILLVPKSISLGVRIGLRSLAVVVVALFAAGLLLSPMAPAQAIEPGSATARIMWDGMTLTTGGNATGWSRMGTVCVTTAVFYGTAGPNGTVGEWVEVSSTQRCGTGSQSTPTYTGCPSTDRFNAAKVKVTATGPGGTDVDIRSVWL